MAEIAERLRLGDVNMDRNERLASVLGGTGLALLGVRQKGVAGALLGAAGAALIARGASGHCPVYGAVGIDTSGRRQRTQRGHPAEPDEGGVSVHASITVNRPAEQAYAVWRDFTNAPTYMDRIASVEILDDTRSRWTATGPMGRSWTWESEVVEDSPGELIAWESLPGSELPNRGWVQFLTSGHDGRQTEIRYFVEFDPPGGVIGDAIAHAFHDAPREMIRGDLRRFRSLLDAAHPAPNAELALGGEG
ncbi:MAG TPA: SRPBCC family protein [Longimicrobium sp.]|nr:SRPBCC family protein [Longimicrobium sp.]